MENKEDKIRELRKFAKKQVVPGAFEALSVLKSQEILINDLKNELEAYVDGRAYDKESGLPWEHWIDHTKELLNKCK